MNSSFETSRSHLLCGALMISALLFVGCDKDDRERAAVAPAVAKPIGHAECASCGMVVAEQPAPRMQVVHRDETREYFCSVSDALHYLNAKNAHGAPTGIFVEVLEPQVDLDAAQKGETMWVPVGGAAFVTGVPRKGIMGPPVLSFRNMKEAQAAAARLHGATATWEDVKSTLLSHE